MTRAEFEELVRTGGFGEPKQVSFPPLSRSPTHQHDMMSFVFVLDGEFILNTPVGALGTGRGKRALWIRASTTPRKQGPRGQRCLSRANDFVPAGIS
jgi:hypothetical protein